MRRETEGEVDDPPCVEEVWRAVESENMRCQGGLGKEDGENIFGPRFLVAIGDKVVVVVVVLGLHVPGIDTIKAETIPCKGGIQLSNRPLCLISRSMYVAWQCEELDFDMFPCVYEVFMIESWEVRDGDECQF